MNKIWKHPKLGTFKFDKERDSWLGKCSLPAFKAFNWEATRASGKYKLMFFNPEEREPSAGAVKLALRTIANEARLPSLVTTALWEEFNGRGPKSEMWWYGDLRQVADNLRYDDRPSPTCPGDLLPVMGFGSLTVHESLYEYKKPIAELRFSAVFEEEHGIGILTDGSTILGTGYSYDVLPYALQHHE